MTAVVHRFALALGLAPMLLVSSAHGSAAPGTAERPRTIIVMDGSGSMWGQIDGRAKLEIARETVAEVVAKLPAEQELGLLAYGHRSKGDCADIELVVPPGPGTAPAVLAAVNSMRFLGKTPLSEAVRQAAVALRYTEEAATVVLVTDGLETCAADPCALAQELEQAGVDFTAHVIGFGLTRAEGAQVACLAEQTGGRYLQADDAAGLSRALNQVVSEPPAAPPQATLDAPAAAPIGSPLQISFSGPLDALDTIDIFDAASGEVADYGYAKSGSPLTLTMPSEPGEYLLRYRWRDQQVVASRPLTAELAQVTLDAPESAAAGTAVQIRWTGPNAQLDNIQIAEAGSKSYISYTYLGDDDQVELMMPNTPGRYELRYKFRDREIIATRPIEVTPAQAP